MRNFDDDEEEDFSDMYENLGGRDDWSEEEDDIEDDDSDPWEIDPNEDIVGYVVTNGWESSKVRCDICSHEWIAVRPDNTPKLECPNCHNVAYYEDLGWEEDEEEEI